MASIVSESGNKEADNFTFSDIDLNPITVDNNPAHFDGFIYSISEFCQRTGKYLPLVTHGVVIRGHKTVVDSPSAVPFEFRSEQDCERAPLRRREPLPFYI